MLESLLFPKMRPTENEAIVISIDIASVILNNVMLLPFVFKTAGRLPKLHLLYVPYHWLFAIIGLLAIYSS